MKKILLIAGVVILVAVMGRVFWAYQQVKNVRTSKIEIDATGSGETDIINNLPISSPKAPVVTLLARDAVIFSGEYPFIDYAVSGATSCTTSGGWSGVQGLLDSDWLHETRAVWKSPSPITIPTTYSLECSGPGGTSSKSVTVVTTTATAVTTPVTQVPTATLSLSRTTAPVGSSGIILSWSSTNATACTVTSTVKEGTSSVQTQGSVQIGTSDYPESWTFSIICTGNGVASKPANATVTFVQNR